MTTKTIQKRTISPFRYDIVGSFLRPERLKQAREQFIKKEITHDELRKIEDEEIIDLIRKQEKAGLKAITDGEFRRSWWHLDFFWGLNGISFKVPDHGYQFVGEETRAGTVTVTGKISGENHPFVEDFKFVRDHVSEGTQVKQTIPAPAQLLIALTIGEELADARKFYDTNESLVDAIVQAYQTVIKDFYDAGARTIQFDDCTWGLLVAEPPDGIPLLEGQTELGAREALKHVFVDINNRVITGLPDDLIINTHVCRGNYHSKWAFSGSYDFVADPLFNYENVDAYYLEYDSDRSGGFEPLKLVSEDKLVVLGLITSKSGQLEDRAVIIDRIHEAAQFIDLDRLALSPQCGFASTEEGNVLTEEQQWTKIAFIKSIAEEVWGD
ncbi:MAG TPA: 5-methyltetrahydropteroyltriglutamate--homocysteine S-methyltransferase [Bavariicoccus seileri]|uniref:5-methyltetrahydropteroyltriglutamate--homocysteine S-methyltransferase n=1 Tax=Bavariicoccus seileri TaxID=549685 RepID=A0A3D4S4G0_9ENTE|nr:5-methyltetrahydropteroyltriglutamate--homocysteine S-methyltransferase [Bavariicoccus seileri]HCS93620.1 5-methyltetrahydropteroyltriglutamate--homocysteine S-methyltransferase [Bavariicoccus seileri]